MTKSTEMRILRESYHHFQTLNDHTFTTYYKVYITLLSFVLIVNSFQRFKCTQFTQFARFVNLVDCLESLLEINGVSFIKIRFKCCQTWSLLKLWKYSNACIEVIISVIWFSIIDFSTHSKYSTNFSKSSIASG